MAFGFALGEKIYEGTGKVADIPLRFLTGAALIRVPKNCSIAYVNLSDIVSSQASVILADLRAGNWNENRRSRSCPNIRDESFGRPEERHGLGVRRQFLSRERDCRWMPGSPDGHSHAFAEVSGLAAVIESSLGVAPSC